MRRLAALLLVLAAPALAQAPRQGAPQAAPCIAQGPLRNVVCADPALRAAEARLRGLEQSVVAATSRPATTAYRIADWRPDQDDLAGGIADRIAGLAEALRIDRAMRRVAPGNAPIPRPAALETRCIGTALRGCHVTGAGVAVGGDGRARVLWQMQRGFTERDGIRAGIVLLHEVRGGWRLLGWSFDGHDVSAPRMIVQDAVTLLHVAGRGGGSGARNTDLLYRRDARGWSEVEMESWHDAATERLPDGARIWQAVDYDIGEMRAVGRLTRGADANCCPSGGSARFDLRLDGTKLALVEMQLDAISRAQRMPPESCPAERATWRLDASEGFTLELTDEWPGTPAASNLSMRVRSEANRQESWFVFAAAQGHGGLSILPVATPGPQTREDGLEQLDIEDDLEPLLGFHAFEADMTALENPPQRGQPAPRFLFMPGLGRAMPYAMLPGQRVRETMPIAIWKLDTCRPEGAR